MHCYTVYNCLEFSLYSATVRFVHTTFTWHVHTVHWQAACSCSYQYWFNTNHDSFFLCILIWEISVNLFITLPWCVLTGSHIDFICLRVLALPMAFTAGTNLIVYLWTLSCLHSLLSHYVPRFDKSSLHTLSNLAFTTCRSVEHYRWLASRQNLPHGMLQTWQQNTLAKIHTHAQRHTYCIVHILYIHLL